MTLKQLKTYVDDMSNRYPEHTDEIIDIYFLACNEVEEGGSETHECELAINDIDYLINE